MKKAAVVRQEGNRVLLFFEGRMADLPWQAAIQLGRALMAQGRAAEEWEKHEQVARDDAILLRAGLGGMLGLSHNPHVRKEAEQLAVHDRDLRRYMPGGVKSEEHVGTPIVIQHPPKGDSHG